MPSNEEDKNSEKYLDNNELKLPDIIIIIFEKIKQKPEKIPKSTLKTKDIPAIREEISYELIQGNNQIRNDINKTNIFKDILLKDIKDIKPRKENNKINIIDKVKFQII